MKMKDFTPLARGEVYHVFNKSIAGFKIFNTENDFKRMELLLRLYRSDGVAQRLSWLIKTGPQRVAQAIEEARKGTPHVQIIACCIMQTHFHLLIKQLVQDGISDYMQRTLNGYARFFNVKRRRKGPLWESRFQHRHIKTTEDALGVTRYIHLNPVTAGLVKKAGDWTYSSYAEFTGAVAPEKCLCDFRKIIGLSAGMYEKFVSDRADYQRSLVRMRKKKLLLDDPAIS